MWRSESEPAVSVLDAPRPKHPLPEQSKEEHEQFYRECIQFYVHRYAVILYSAVQRKGVWPGSDEAQEYLHAIFRNHETSMDRADQPILDEIKNEVYRQAAEARIQLSIDLAG